MTRRVMTRADYEQERAEKRAERSADYYIRRAEKVIRLGGRPTDLDVARSIGITVRCRPCDEHELRERIMLARSEIEARHKR